MSQAIQIERLEAGLRAAHAAGRVDEAKQIGIALRKAMQTKAESDQRKTDLQPEMADTAEGRFDQVRPQLTDGIFGESVGRSVDAGIMGMADQMGSLSRGIQNLIPGGASDSELDQQAASSAAFAEQTYGSSNPASTMVGGFAPSLATAVLPGGLPAQMAYGAAESAITHTAGDNAGIDAAIGAATTGIFGKAFDLMGRAIGNSGKALFGREPTPVSGQTREETARLIKVADDEGIEITPAQRTREKRRMQDEARMASQPSGQPLNDIREAQIEDINKMVLDRFGVENAVSWSPAVRRQIDNKIGKAFDDVEKGIPNTAADDEFLGEAAEIAVLNNLTKEQATQMDDIALEVASGMSGKSLMDLRKRLQKSIQNNLRGGNGDYADALHDMVNAVDNLIERSAPTDIAMRYADVRDMSRMRMALERGSSISPDGDINAASFSKGLERIYRKEFGRGAGHWNDSTNRVFDAARLGSMLNDKIGNSGTATRSMQTFSDRVVDKVWNEPKVGMYLAQPNLYGMFDPVSELAQDASYRAARMISQDEEGLQGLLGIK